MSLEKGTRVRISGNSIFEFMGYQSVTGTIALVHGDSFSFKCDQTRAHESCDLDDGTIEVI